MRRLIMLIAINSDKSGSIPWHTARRDTVLGHSITPIVRPRFHDMIRHGQELQSFPRNC